MMKRSFRDKWSAALRSGKYEQGHDYLCKDGKCCCLGVALFVEGVETPKVSADGVTTFYHESGEARVSLSISASDRLGIEAHLPSRLIRMNDLDRKTFADIADYLDTLPVEEDVATLGVGR